MYFTRNLQCFQRISTFSMGMSFQGIINPRGMIPLLIVDTNLKESKFILHMKRNRHFGSFGILRKWRLRSITRWMQLTIRKWIKFMRQFFCLQKAWMDLKVPSKKSFMNCRGGSFEKEGKKTRCVGYHRFERWLKAFWSWMS